MKHYYWAPFKIFWSIFTLENDLKNQTVEKKIFVINNRIYIMKKTSNFCYQKMPILLSKLCEST